MPQAEGLQHLLQPAIVQAAYTGLCVTDLSSSWIAQEQTISAADVQTYLAGLQQGAILQAKAVTERTQQCRDKALQEFSTWLASHVKCRNIADCLPEDFVVYLTTNWTLEHAGSEADGAKVAAPVSVNALISHLAIEFDKLGRTGPWQPAAKIGT